MLQGYTARVAGQHAPTRTSAPGKQERSAPANTEAGPFVFAYFKEPGTQGIYLALSRDGYTYTPLNDGEAWLKRRVPGEIFREV